MQRALALLGILACLSSSVHAEEKYTFIVEKQENKAKRRWSLADWLDTRDQMRVQDLWLAMHSPTPYEFYLGALYKSGNLEGGGGYQGWDFHAAAYAYMFGIEVQRQTSTQEQRWLALVNFRPFGAYNQATNLTFQGGMKQEDRSGASHWTPVVGANVTLYFAKAFGAVFLYRHAFGQATGIAADLGRIELGAFIDFKFIRVHADYLKETQTGDPARSFQGFQVGTRMYF